MVPKETIEKVVALLAESPLGEEIKKIISDNFGQLPDYMVFKLLSALEGEKEELERIAFELELFFKEQDKNWKVLEEEQGKTADDFVKNYLKKEEDEADLVSVRKNLGNL